MYTKLIIDEPPLQVLPKLAIAIGLNEAITLQQIHWLLLTYGKEREGRLWIYNTYEDWKANQFPFWSTNTIRRVLSNLEEGGYVLTGVFNRSPIDNTKWYSIDYDAVSALVSRLAKSADDLPKMGRPLAQNEQITPAQNGQTNTNRKREQKEEDDSPSVENNNQKPKTSPASSKPKTEDRDGRMLIALIRQAGFVYLDSMATRTAMQLENDYTDDQLRAALAKTQEAHQKQINTGKKGITAPLAYLSQILLGMETAQPESPRQPLVDALIAVHGLQAVIGSKSPDAARKEKDMHELASTLHEMKMGVKDIERFSKLWAEKDFRGQKKQRPQNGQFLTFISQQLADTSGFPAEDPGERATVTITDSWEA